MLLDLTYCFGMYDFVFENFEKKYFCKSNATSNGEFLIYIADWLDVLLNGVSWISTVRGLRSQCFCVLLSLNEYTLTNQFA